MRKGGTTAPYSFEAGGWKLQIAPLKLLRLPLHCIKLNSLTFYSSENTDGSKGRTHRELMITVAEMKKRLPSDKRNRSKASTVEALHYALNCVKQVQGNLTTENSYVLSE